MMIYSIRFFIIHLNSSWYFLDLVIVYVVLVVASLFFKPTLLHHYFCATIHITLHHVVHIVFHHYWSLCSSRCSSHLILFKHLSSCIIVITFIVIVFNSIIVMCIVTTLDSLIASLGVTLALLHCLISSLLIFLHHSLSSLSLFFHDSLTKGCLNLSLWFVMTLSNEKLVGYGFHLFQHFLVKAFHDMTFKFIYLSSLCLCKLFIGDVNNFICTMKKQNHENWRKIEGKLSFVLLVIFKLFIFTIWETNAKEFHVFLIKVFVFLNKISMF